MKKMKSISACLCIIVLVLLPALLGASCAREVSAQEISDSSVAAYAQITTYRMSMETTQVMEMAIGQQNIKANAGISGTATMDIPARQMQMSMTVDLEGTSPQPVDMTARMDIYAAGGWMYVKTDMAPSPAEWTKTRLSDEVWASQNQAEQLVAMLDTAVQVESLGTEKVGGVDCYVLKVNPDMVKLFEWLMSQQQAAGLEGLDLGKLNPAGWFKNTVIKVWIAQDTRLIMREDVSMLLDMNTADFGAPAEQAGKMTIDMTGKFTFSDYNKPVTISLPPEALQAQQTG